MKFGLYFHALETKYCMDVDQNNFQLPFEKEHFELDEGNYLCYIACFDNSLGLVNKILFGSSFTEPTNCAVLSQPSFLNNIFSTVF